jgi:signal peptide peptidase SppA
MLMMDPRAVDGLWKLAGDMAKNPQKFSDEESPRPADDGIYKLYGAAREFDVPENPEPGSVIAVVPIAGTITRHGYHGWYSYHAGTLDIGRNIQALDRDPAIAAIVLSINSPGGEVYGTPELSKIIYDIREKGNTKVVASVDPLMASAATYIGTAAEEIYAIPSADVGSVGVISAYTDLSDMYENMGVKINVFRVPDKKARFSGVEPMDENMKETMQQSIDETYEQFVADLGRNRGVTEKHVKRHFGQGEVMPSQEGIDAGMIDGLASLDDVLTRLSGDIKDRRKDYKRRAASKRARDLQLRELG